MDDSRVTTYRCQRCGAIDRDKGNNPPAPPSLNCYRSECRGKGTMLPVPNDTKEEPLPERLSR